MERYRTVNLKQNLSNKLDVHFLKNECNKDIEDPGIWVVPLERNAKHNEDPIWVFPPDEECSE